jgi:hypothetical protein
LGSFFAGIKAGTLGGIIYIGGLALFNAFLLLAMKPDVIAFISQSRTYSQVCGAGSAVNSTALNQCYSSVLTDYVPIIAFVGFFIVLFYSGLFGVWYEKFPGESSVVKGEEIAAIAGINLVYFGFYGFAFNFESGVATAVFLVLWTGVFGYLVSRLYTRYTRVVTFQSQDEGALKVFVDGRNLTGKARTFALTSSHRLRAEVSEDASFREWETTGGVKVEDPRSFETVFEVSGDGLLKAAVGKKY